MENLSVFVVEFLIAIAVIAGLYWLIAAFHAPKWVNVVIDILILGSLFDGPRPGRRHTADTSPDDDMAV